MVKIGVKIEISLKPDYSVFFSYFKPCSNWRKQKNYKNQSDSDLKLVKRWAEFSKIIKNVKI
jgi:hypothetical protein